MNARLMAVSVAIVAVIALGGGCGSGSGGGSSSEVQSGSATGGASRSSKAAFVKRANAACLENQEGALERLAAYEKGHRSDGLTKAELTEKAIRAVELSTIESEIAAIRALGPAPEGDTAAIKAIVAALEKDLAAAKESKNSSKEVEDYFLDADKMLQDFGISGCTM